jgi:hypothetical protein
MWRDLYEKRRGEIVDFFRDYPRFMIFNIEQDKPEKLAQFLQADFNLDCSKWIHRGKARRV